VIPIFLLSIQTQRRILEIELESIISSAFQAAKRVLLWLFLNKKTANLSKMPQ